MAGVYIKGVKMPKGCSSCPYIDRLFNPPKCKARSIQGRFMEQKLNLHRTRQKWCPLVPVPPHGDLIDREAIVDSVCNGVCSCSECSFNQNPFDSCVLQTNLEKLKIVIPAERSEE